nr:hypothetical protein GCM10025730_12880 [Promicromonospora thailandica]
MGRHGRGQRPRAADRGAGALGAAGETLWGYAQEVARPGEDVRDAVARLQDLNEMSTASVRVGELLLLPEE